MRHMKLLITLIIASGIYSHSAFAQNGHVVAEAHAGGSDGMGGSDGSMTDSDSTSGAPTLESLKKAWSRDTYIEVRNLGDKNAIIGIFACTADHNCSPLGSGLYRENVLKNNVPQNNETVAVAINEILVKAKGDENSDHNLQVNSEKMVENLNDFLLKLPPSE